MNRCGPLDVADAHAFLPTGPVPPAELAACRAAALADPAFDGRRDAGKGTLILGRRTVAKLQHRRHERLETLERLEKLRQRGIVPAPRLLSTGTHGELWWAILERAGGEAATRPTETRQRAVGAALRAWHDRAEPGGLRLDEPGGLGVLLGTPRAVLPGAYPELAKRFDLACAGLPVTAIHGDAGVGHNVLFDGDRLTAVLDPGAVETGPPVLDLAWALAVDLPRGGRPEPLLAGYGEDAVDDAALAALLPLLFARRLVDTVLLGTVATEGNWLVTHLRDRAPDLHELIVPELGALAPTLLSS